MGEPEMSNRGLWKRSVQQKDEKDVCEDSEQDFCQNFMGRKFCESEGLRNICKESCGACSGLKNIEANLEPEMSNRGLWKRSVQQKDEKFDDAGLKNIEANLEP